MKNYIKLITQYYPVKSEIINAFFLLITLSIVVLDAFSVNTSYPILIIVNPESSNPFGRFAGEILKTEGFNEFQFENLGKVDLAYLSKFDMVLLTETPLTQTEKIMFENYVNGGGNLLTFKPDISKIATLCGVESSAGQLSDGYLKITDNGCVGDGLDTAKMKYHGVADQYIINFGSHKIAGLYSNNTTETGYAAVVQSCYGTGKVVAYSYDLCKSLVYMRQGNPEWAAQERDGWEGLRPGDLFSGKSGNFNDDSKFNIQQADEQMRLVGHALEWFASFKKPLPKFWYLPEQNKAITVFTGDSDFAGDSLDNDELTTVNNFKGHATI